MNPTAHSLTLHIHDTYIYIYIYILKFNKICAKQKYLDDPTLSHHVTPPLTATDRLLLNTYSHQKFHQSISISRGRPYRFTWPSKASENSKKIHNYVTVPNWAEKGNFERGNRLNWRYSPKQVTNKSAGTTWWQFPTSPFASHDTNWDVSRSRTSVQPLPHRPFISDFFISFLFFLLFSLSFSTLNSSFFFPEKQTAELPFCFHVSNLKICRWSYIPWSQGEETTFTTFSL